MQFLERKLKGLLWLEKLRYIRARGIKSHRSFRLGCPFGPDFQPEPPHSLHRNPLDWPVPLQCEHGRGSTMDISNATTSNTRLLRADSIRKRLGIVKLLSVHTRVPHCAKIILVTIRH